LLYYHSIHDIVKSQPSSLENYDFPIFLELF